MLSLVGGIAAIGLSLFGLRYGIVFTNSAQRYGASEGLANLALAMAIAGGLCTGTFALSWWYGTH